MKNYFIKNGLQEEKSRLKIPIIKTPRKKAAAANSVFTPPQISLPDGTSKRSRIDRCKQADFYKTGAFSKIFKFKEFELGSRPLDVQNLRTERVYLPINGAHS